MLLEDAFPKMLSKEWKYQDEQSKLQGLVPARRVLVVGDNVQNAQDITEPVQWLMR